MAQQASTSTIYRFPKPFRSRIARARPIGSLLGTGALHEVYSSGPADLPAVAGFAAGFALRAALGGAVVWIIQDGRDGDAGRLHPAGLVEFGLDPGAIILVRVRGVADALRAMDEAARCPGLTTVLLEIQGPVSRLDLTATRRLSLATRASGVRAILLRTGAEPTPSAAWTRWRVGTLPSRTPGARAPGPAAFSVALLKDRGGAAPHEWVVEWNRDKACLEPRAATGAAPLPRAVAAPAADREVAVGSPLRDAG